MRYWPTVRSRWLGTGRVLFFARRSRGPWSRKWRTKLIYSHLDQTGPVNKGFITTHKDFASTRILNDMFIFERLQRKPTVMACACLCFLCFDCLLTLLVIPFPALSRNYELWKSAPCIFPHRRYQLYDNRKYLTIAGFCAHQLYATF